MGSTVVEDEDVEYESDPEDVKRSLAMRRRREASDDEEAEGEYDDGRGNNTSDPRVIHSDDSEGEGGVADYDDDDEEEELEEEYDEEEDEEGVEDEVYEERGVEEGGAEVVNGAVVMLNDSGVPAADDVNTPLEEGDSGNKDAEEKKENEPFAVPTAGAFYMHDDRFRDNAGARNRRMNGGRRLWESKDERKWGHDKFEEIASHERHNKEGRRPTRGNYRGGRGRTRAIDRGGHVQGNRRGFIDNSGNQGQAPKRVVRGRGPRRYEPANKRNNDPASQMQNKQSSKPQEKISHVSSGRTVAPTASSESDPAPAKKQVFASNLNYASPPFYPSGSSNKEINPTPKRDVQTGTTSRNFRPTNEGFSVQQNNASLRGKNVVDSIGMDKLYIEKPMNNLHIPPPQGSTGVNASQSPHLRGPGRVGPIPVQMNYQPVTTHNRVNKVAPTQLQATQRSSAPLRTSTSVQAPAPQFGNRPGSGSQASSPTKADSGEIDSASESGKSKVALVGKGRGASQQGSGRGFIYGGPMGTAVTMGGGHGDPNFPAFLPVMQFGGQHPGGIGVPAVGMAFPGYVAQPQNGGSSEMTWLPVLAGAAGALGASYCPPYLTVDGAYHARPSGQASAPSTVSKESNANNKANNELRPPQRLEPVKEKRPFSLPFVLQLLLWSTLGRNRFQEFLEYREGLCNSNFDSILIALVLLYNACSCCSASLCHCSLTGGSCLCNCAVFVAVCFLSEDCMKHR
ncbi:hypothetical protein RIF29_28172 [Crotalaria pallida]|uniref:Btz domain-containing protein n=1 Tax=Crotalaria pallida TaxID=3830 RepID=A0AAN9I1Q1_CROPI